jgi:hypothetical protein
MIGAQIYGVGILRLQGRYSHKRNYLIGAHQFIKNHQLLISKMEIEVPFRRTFFNWRDQFASIVIPYLSIHTWLLDLTQNI